MRTNTLSVPEDIIINLLKSLPPKKLVEVFSKTLIGYDTSPLSQQEKKSVSKAKEEFKKGQTIRWQDI